MSKRLVNREEVGKLIAQTSGASSNYIVRSTSGENTYTLTASKSGWACSCPDYASRLCKHVYAVQFYRSQSATS